MPSNKGYQLDTIPASKNEKHQLEKTLSMSKGDKNEEIDTSCCCLCCKPGCSKSGCNSAKGLGAAIAFFVFEYGIIQLGVVNIIIVPLQRRYGFTATQAAWIPAAQDFFGGIFAVIIGYIGTFVHKGKLMTLAALAQFIAGSLFLMVHFISSNYEAGEADMEVCDPENPPGCDDQEAGGYNLYFWILIFAQMLHGYCGGTIFCVAVPYMDENTKPKNTPLYIGIMYGMTAAGAMAGYILGGLSLLVYVDFHRVDMDDIDITPGDPRWVGAWWIPYIFGVVGAAIALFLMASFPRYVPDAMRHQAERKTEAYGGAIEVSTSQSRGSQIWQSTKLLFTNPTWVLLTIAGVFESGMMNGFIIFFPAIIVFQFDQNPAEAALVAGVVVVPAAIFGQILGGMIPRRCKFTVKGLIAQTGIMALAVAILAPVMLLRCPTPDIAGVNVAFHNTNKTIDYKELTDACNEDCGCDTRSYDPICGINDVQYFSPCHAACLNKGENDDGDEVFYNCGCIDKAEDVPYAAVSGACDSDCRYFDIFLGVFFFATLFIFIGVTSGISATVRCVPESERSYGAGLQSTLVRFLGNVPFPIMMGAIFDQSCLVWQDTCDVRGSCWLYDPAALAVGLAIIVLVSKVIAVFCHLAAILVYKAPPPDVMEHEVIIDTHLFNVNYVECKPADDIDIPMEKPQLNGHVFTVSDKSKECPVYGEVISETIIGNVDEDFSTKL